MVDIASRFWVLQKVTPKANAAPEPAYWLNKFKTTHRKNLAKRFTSQEEAEAHMKTLSDTWKPQKVVFRPPDSWIENGKTVSLGSMSTQKLKLLQKAYQDKNICSVKHWKSLAPDKPKDGGDPDLYKAWLVIKRDPILDEIEQVLMWRGC